MEANSLVAVLIIFLVLTILRTNNAAVIAEACSNTTLSGGFLPYEGMVTVFYNGTWVNVCADSFNDSDQESVCFAILEDGVMEKPTHYENNEYRATPLEKTISYKRCSKSAVNDHHSDEQTCRRASLCCYESSFEASCSTNWNETLKLQYRIQRSGKRHLRYSELISTNFTGMNIIKSWTRSALIEGKCVSNTLERNCSRRCPVTTTLTFVSFSGENRTCCKENKIRQYSEEENCPVRELTVVDGNTAQSTSSIRFCLAAEVIDGALYISAEDCGLFLQPFNVSTDLLPVTTTTVTTPVTVTTYNSYSDVPTTTVSSSSTTTGVPEAFNTVIIAVVVIVSFLVLVVIVFTTVILWKLRQSSRRGEKQRPNSIVNRAYTIEGHIRQDDEEYTLISDMEVEQWSAECYKPPVPDRSDSKSNKSDKGGVEIITLGDYCSPSDQIKVGYKISQTSDYCTTTYDDPIRLKLKEADETSNKLDDKENCSCDIKEQLRNTSENSTALENNSRKSQERSSAYEIAFADLIASDTESVVKVQKMQEENTENFKMSLHKQKQLAHTGEHSKCGNTIEEQYEDTESLESPPKDTNDDFVEDEKENSDYEDPNNLDWNFKTTCSSKTVLEEHICLHCLKPEHLTKLGIKLISDEMYEKHIEIQRSQSEPSSHVHTSYYNIGQAIRAKYDQGRHSVEPNSKNSCYQTEEDSLADLKVLRRKKSSGNTKRCSVCNTVYDKLGSTHQNAWENCTDNVYDMFGDFKHFKHRQQLSGKRINST